VCSSDLDPFFAEYCNGSTVTCAGLSQWGTVSLAQSGLSVEEILQFYYGNVEITQTNNIQAVESSYPGSPLRVGSSGAAVRTIQQQLNRIRVNYPAIPAINRVDGVFGNETRRAVEAFQRIFDLTPDGVVGKSTWYRISYIYVAVKKLAELNSEGERPQYDDNSYPGLLRFGDTGTGVQTLQLYLKTIAAFNPFLPDVAIDGFFGRGTENAVRAFQEYYGLPVDGIVGESTWNRIVSVYLQVTEEGTLSIRPYPGAPLRFGSSGEEVRYLQKLLNRIRRVFPTVRSLAEDGIFGSQMRSSVREFQRLFGLTEDGVVGRNTWNAINRVFGSVQSGCLSDGDTVTGRLLRYGSAGADVRSIQNQLNTVRRSVRALPAVTVDGQFGRGTENAVITFQRLFGLTPDGVVGNTTRTRLATAVRGVEEGCLPVAGSARAEAVSAEPLGEKERRFLSGWPETCPWRDLDSWEGTE
jgi:peptidoglycan hydrolase-like protein with peptidoglycan-binding domain